MDILNTAFEYLLGSYPANLHYSYPHLFDHESGQETITRLYEIMRGQLPRQDLEELQGHDAWHLDSG